MKNLGIKVEYIYHSGYTIETDRYFLVFDYFRGDIHIPTDKTVIVFVSHGHPDHYNEEIFKWSNESSNLTYVLSDDIDIQNTEHITRIAPYETKVVSGVKIDTLLSTDMGVAYILNLDGISIFFAGDLHWWYWDDDSKSEKRRMEMAFKSEIARIKGLNADLAFFPVDARLGEYYYLGGEYFINEVNPSIFFPLHFGEDYKVIDRFINKMGAKNTKIMKVTERNQKFTL
ncbi:MAG: MBL fold metallo-hydrolase [Gudongella sp.]|jgi:L-ascorbate metabolism protein UlaG (beta-lactamase superfamily)|nr:MBL fold metallo-hydrolase [Gudongella sp.]